MMGWYFFPLFPVTFLWGCLEDDLWRDELISSGNGMEALAWFDWERLVDNFFLFCFYCFFIIVSVFGVDDLWKVILISSGNGREVLAWFYFEDYIFFSYYCLIIFIISVFGVDVLWKVGSISSGNGRKWWLGFYLGRRVDNFFPLFFVFLAYYGV